MMEHQKLDELIAFDPANKIRKRVFIKEKLEMELVCYSPGHATVEHHHAGQDEIILHWAPLFLGYPPRRSPREARPDLG